MDPIAREQLWNAQVALVVLAPAPRLPPRPPLQWVVATRLFPPLQLLLTRMLAELVAAFFAEIFVERLTARRAGLPPLSFATGGTCARALCEWRDRKWDMRYEEYETRC